MVRKFRRGRRKENRWKRGERRYQRRVVRRGGAGERVVGWDMVRGGRFVNVTWNVQGISVRENKRIAKRMVVDNIAREEWGMVGLLS